MESPDLNAQGSSSARPRGGRESALLISIGLLCLCLTSSRMVYNGPDLWGHLLYGLEHLETGSLARLDPYSYTAPQANWTNHEWLCEIVYAWAWKDLGSWGLWGVRFVLVGMTFGIILRLAQQRTTGGWAALFVFILAWVNLNAGLTIRPQLFTYLLFAAELFLIDRIFITRAWHISRSVLLVLLMGLWANLHGGFLVGLGIVGVLCIHQLISCVGGAVRSRQLLIVLLVTVGAFLATLINPYGVGLWRWLYLSLSSSRSGQINEWQSVLSGSQLNYLDYYALLMLTLATVIACKCSRNWFEIAVLAVTALASWMQNRHIAFFSIAVAMYLPKYFESWCTILCQPLRINRGVVGAVSAALIMLGIAVHLAEGRQPGRMLVQTREHPHHLFQAIRDNGLSGNMIVYFNWAQSSLWYLHDRCKIAFDGRFRTVYPRQVEADFFHFHFADDRWTNLIENYESTIVLMPAKWRGAGLLQVHPNWELFFDGRRADHQAYADHPDEAPLLFIKKGAFPQLESHMDGWGLRLDSPAALFEFGKLD